MKRTRWSITKAHAYGVWVVLRRRQSYHRGLLSWLLYRFRLWLSIMRQGSPD